VTTDAGAPAAPPPDEPAVTVPGPPAADPAPSAPAAAEPATGADPAAEQFVVSADPATLQQVISGLEVDPAVEVLTVSGPATAPSRFVARMDQTRADPLQHDFGDRLIVEPDAPLEPF
jgi:hypothetical protein